MRYSTLISLRWIIKFISQKYINFFLFFQHQNYVNFIQTKKKYLLIIDDDVKCLKIIYIIKIDNICF